MEKTKILYIVSSLHNCGPTNQLLYLLTNLDKRKFDPVILTLNSEKDQTRILEFENLGISIHQSQVLSKYHLIKILTNILSHIKKINPDIIHTQGTRPDFISGLLLNDYIRISTLRSFPQDDYGKTYNFIATKILLKLHEIAFSRINAIVGVSQAVSKNLSTISKLNKIMTIENSYQDLRTKQCELENHEYLMKSLNLQKGDIIFLTAGGLIARKDPLWLINFWAKNFSMKSNIKLFILGDGPLFSECKLASRNSENIKILGNVNNIYPFLKLADFFISTSHAEGLPNAVLEALGEGKTCILSGIEPHKEISRKFSEGIILYELNNEKSLINVLSRLDPLKARSRARLVSETLTKNYNAKRMALKYEELYLELTTK